MKIENGTLYLVDDRDYCYEGYKKINAPKYTYQDCRIAYWQSEVHKLSCSLHATITAISNNHNYKFSIDERKEILQLAIDRGFDKNYGWYMSKAVKCVVDYCNERLGMDLIYIRVPWTQFIPLAKIGHSIVTGWKQKGGLGKDRANDGIVGNEGIKYSDTIYGHLFSCPFFNKRPNQKQDVGYNNKPKGKKKFGLVDQYYPHNSKNETYIENIADLVRQDVLFANGYIIVKKDQAKAKTIQGFKQKVRDFRKIIKNLTNKRK